MSRPQDPSDEVDVERCQQVLRQHEASLLALPEVIGVGVGQSDDGQIGLILLVRELPAGGQPDTDPPWPKILEGVPVWPRPIGSISAQRDEVGGE